jgi:hypothetical protein
VQQYRYAVFQGRKPIINVQVQRNAGSIIWERHFGSSCGAESLLRPTSKQLAMAFYQSLSFKLRKRLSTFIRLVDPHMTDGTSVGATETLHLSGVANEVNVQCQPASSRFPHSAEPPWLSPYESAQSTPPAQPHKQPRREAAGLVPRDNC